MSQRVCARCARFALIKRLNPDIGRSVATPENFELQSNILRLLSKVKFQVGHVPTLTDEQSLRRKTRPDVFGRALESGWGKSDGEIWKSRTNTRTPGRPQRGEEQNPNSCRRGKKSGRSSTGAFGSCLLRPLERVHMEVVSVVKKKDHLRRNWDSVVAKTIPEQSDRGGGAVLFWMQVCGDCAAGDFGAPEQHSS